MRLKYCFCNCAVKVPATRPAAGSACATRAPAARTARAASRATTARTACVSVPSFRSLVFCETVVFGWFSVPTVCVSRPCFWFLLACFLFRFDSRLSSSCYASVSVGFVSPVPLASIGLLILPAVGWRPVCRSVSRRRRAERRVLTEGNAASPSRSSESVCAPHCNGCLFCTAPNC